MPFVNLQYFVRFQSKVLRLNTSKHCHNPDVFNRLFRLLIKCLL